MHGIYLMLIITLAISVLVYGLYIFTASGRKARYLLLLLPGLPLSALINILVKGPLATAVGDASGYGVAFAIGMPVLLMLFYALLAPVTEELIKISPLLVPQIRRMAQPQKLDALWTGFALGAGFGLGEAIYVAYQVGQAPAYAGIPWYMFTGFLIERFLVIFAHGAMTAVFTSFLFQGWGRALLGYLIAITLHFILNASVPLMQLGFIDGNLGSLFIVASVLALVLIFEVIRRVTRRRESRGEVLEGMTLEAEGEKE